MHELALFAGAGGGLLATTHILKWRTVCYVEWDAYCIDVLKQRIKDGYLHDAPIWDDVQTFDGRPWAGCVDIVTAGFPCQPFSEAGKQKAGDDTRNMWPDTFRIIGEIKPEWILLENVTGLLSGTHGYFGYILGQLAESGYDVRWDCIPASSIGSPHRRDRVFIVAHTEGVRQTSDRKWSTGLAYRRSSYTGWGWVKAERCTDRISFDVASRRCLGGMWNPQSTVQRTTNGLADQLDRLKAIGNGQVPAVVATVWRLLTEGE